MASDGHDAAVLFQSGNGAHAFRLRERDGDGY